ncbi:MAG TPA: CAP domain-containing protein [Steroidobacteraceae bacterium]|jgi:uncharacterized protein YkwD
MILCLCTPLAAFANLATDLNTLRSRGCTGHAGVSAPLRPNRALDQVAQQWSRGGRLSEALARTSYRAVNSASMRITGAPNDSSILKVLGQSYCATVTNTALTEQGIYRHKGDVWIVLASPFTTPTIKDAREIGNRALALVNAARSKPRKCGSRLFPPVASLQLSAMLTQAALIQAQDMSAHENFEHEGTDGSTPAQRVSRTGYQWLNVGENIAAGAATVDEVIAGWLNSPSHCANIMGAAYTEMGIAYVADPKTKAGIYWSQVFGRKR